MHIDRAFVRLDEGLLHYRHTAGDGAGDARPLLMLHLSPSSSRSLEPLMSALQQAGTCGALIAPDTLGNGDSAAPARPDADIAYFADSMVRLLDRLKLGRVDLYGTHTGARTACEIAAAHPDRVGRLVLSGITRYDEASRRLFQEDYVPRVVPDDYGRQMVWAFNFVRDQHLFAPYFKRTAAHRLAKDVPSAEVLHASAIDILKALGTYHIPYLAAFEYETFERAALVRAPTLLLKPDTGTPSLNAAADTVAAVMPDARTVSTSGGIEGYAQAIAAFLQGEPRIR